MAENPVPEKALHDKIEEMITDDLIANQSGQSQLAKLILYELNGPGWETEAQAIEKLRAVTPGDVQAAAKKYLKSFNFAVLGNPEQIDEKLFTSR
jgi:predicted Zn-dependent peptidase